MLLAVGMRLPEFEADPAADALVSLVVTAVVDPLPDEPELDEAESVDPPLLDPPPLEPPPLDPPLLATGVAAADAVDIPEVPAKFVAVAVKV